MSFIYYPVLALGLAYPPFGFTIMWSRQGTKYGRYDIRQAPIDSLIPEVWS